VAVTPAAPAPYAPASAIVDFIDKYRNRGLPSPITLEVLARVGISESLIARTLQALVSLDLIDADGAPTNILESLRRVPESEFRPKLVEWLNSAYAEVLKFVDPASSDEAEIRDAFRNYNPVGQQPRMVTLFTGLYSAAGLRDDRQVQSRTSSPRIKSRNEPTQQKVRSRHASTNPERKVAPPPDMGSHSGIPAAISSLLASVPFDQRSWSKEERDAFLDAFGGLLNFYVKVSSGQLSDGDTVQKDSDPGS